MMNDRLTKSSFIGHARTVLFMNRGKQKIAVVSDVFAQVHNESNPELSVFKGLINYEGWMTDHIRDMVFPIADKIFKTLYLPPKNFEISVIPQRSDSKNRADLKFDDYYLDVPVLLAILSAGLRITIPGNIISVGSIVSPRGDLLIERKILEELIATLIPDTAFLLVHPPVDYKSCTATYSEERKQKLNNTDIENIRTVTIHDFADLILAVFSEEQIVSASLKQGFFKATIPCLSPSEPIQKASALLGHHNVQRFWTVLEKMLVSNRNKEARSLLLEFIRFHLDRKRYPEDLGNGLHRILDSLKMVAGSSKSSYPLISISECIQLIKCSLESDHKDVEILFEAIFEDRNRSFFQFGAHNQSNDQTRMDSNQKKLRSLLSALDQDTLVKQINFPIDSARASYLMNSVTIKDYREFNDAIVSYYTHLLGNGGRVFAPADSKTNEAEALSLLERAFTTKGGLKGALAEARDGTNGGLRIVLDMMTDQLKREEQEKHISYVLKSAIDPLNWESKVALMDQLMRNLKHMLPIEISSYPAERFAGQYELIVNAYVESINDLNSIFRRL